MGPKPLEKGDWKAAEKKAKAREKADSQKAEQAKRKEERAERKERERQHGMHKMYDLIGQSGGFAPYGLIGSYGMNLPQWLGGKPLDASGMDLDAIGKGIANAVRMARFEYQHRPHRPGLPKRAMGDMLPGKMRRMACTQETLDILHREETLRTVVLKDGWKNLSNKQRRLQTAKKWTDHMTQLTSAEGQSALVEIIVGHFNTVVRGWSRYFAVPKTETEARAILNAKEINSWFHRPFSINLCDPPSSVRNMLRMLGPEREKLREEGKEDKIWVVSLDWRHWFHQIGTGEFLRSFFGLSMESEGNPDVIMRWLNLPMGWSWAPRIAQCLGWHLVAYEPGPDSEHQLNTDWKAKAPPQWIRTKDGKGVVFLYIDNVHAYFLEKSEAERFMRNVARNMDYFGVHLKYAYLDDEELTWKSCRECKEDEFHKIDIVLERARDKDGVLKPLAVPGALGMEYLNGVDGAFGVRLEEKKVEKLRKIELRREDVRTPKAIASVVGKVLYRRQLTPAGHRESSKLIKLLSKAGKWVGGKKSRWSSEAFHSEITNDDWDQIVKDYEELRRNDWIYPDRRAGARDIVFAASDAAGGEKDKKLKSYGGGWGYTIYPGLYKPDEIPSKSPASNAKLLTVRGGRFLNHPNKKWVVRHIYLKEMYAAVEAVKAILETHEGVEIVLAVDNAATRAALNRGISINEVAADMLVDMYALLEGKGATLKAVPIPGYYNVADYPSRDESIPLGSHLHKNPPKKEYLKEFNPTTETWKILLEGYRGLIRGYTPEEIDCEEGIIHDEPVEELDEETFELCWDALAHDEGEEEEEKVGSKRARTGTHEEGDPPWKRSRLEDL